MTRAGTAPAAGAASPATPPADGAARRVRRAVGGLDGRRLAPLVRRALGCPTLDVVDWRHAQIAYLDTNPVSLGLFRLSGTARDGATDGATAVPWSLILKVVRSPSGVALRDGRRLPVGYGVDPAHDQYWRREVHAYQSRLLAALPAGLAAPRCLAVEEDRAGAVWLWLEDVPDDYTARGESWPLARYGLAARHFGRFNGTYLAGRPLPEDAWLSRGWLRQWVTHRRLSEAQRALLAAPGTWAHPMVHRLAPEPLGERLLRSEDRIGALLGAVDRLPRAVSHLDAYSQNLLSRRTPVGSEETVAIDWAFVGIAPVGVESGQLSVATALRGGVPGADVRRLDRHVFEGYLAGLREAGWSGDGRQARLGHTACAALRFRFVVALTIATALDERRYPQLEQRFGRPVEALMEERGHLARYMLDSGDEAEELARPTAPTRVAE